MSYCKRTAPLLLLLLCCLAGAQDRGMGVVAAPDGRTPVGEQYLFIVAVNKYEHWNPIGGPVPEATKLRKVLLDRYAFTPKHTVFLKDKQATRGAIVKQFKTYRRTLKPADSLLVVFCGHGHLDPDAETGYWIPVDGGLDEDVKDRWLPNAEVRGYLKNIPARHVLVIADSCFSGQLLTASRAKPAEITNEYYRRAYQRMARQIMTSGAVEKVRDASAFGEALYNELLANHEPYIDPAKLFVNVRAAVQGQQPLLGSLKSANHQDGGAFLFFLKPGAQRRAPLPNIKAGPALRDFGGVKLECRLGGKLYVDGRYLSAVKAGRSYTLEKLAAGSRQFRIEGDQGRWSQAVLVRRNETLTVEAEAPGPTLGESWTVPDLGLVLMPIKAGSFMMGSPATEEDRGKDEAQHKVTLTKSYWLGKYEVTQGEFAAFVRATGHKTTPESGGYAYVFEGGKYEKKTGALWRTVYPGDKRPVVCISWTDAMAFCAWLTDRERGAGRLPSGYEYRLPTECEWEYACRSGTQTAFAYGASLSSRQANFDGDYPYGGGVKGPDLGKTVDVGSYKPNGWGLYDMHGNVWEWCLDWYGDYPAGPATDPVGPRTGSYRVNRGGGWFNSAGICRAAFRGRGDPARPGTDLGFRVALAPAVQR